jgi:ribonuclease HI
MLYPDQTDPQEMVGAERDTTNNRMELRAAAEALRSLSEPHQVEIYTDSKYLRQGITEWLSNWEYRNWQTSDKTEVKNQDLWQSLSVQNNRHTVNWHWVKGHAGNKWNERVDKLATAQIPQPKLPLDDQNAVHIFLGAAYSGKKKEGGWGVVLRYQEHVKTLSGTEAKSSGNRMHILGAIEGLQAIKNPLPIHIYTNSDYLKDSATRWIKGWIARDWKTKEGKSVSNRDLWEKLVDLTKDYQVSWHVVSKINQPDEMPQAKEVATESLQGG